VFECSAGTGADVAGGDSASAVRACAAEPRAADGAGAVANGDSVAGCGAADSSGYDSAGAGGGGGRETGCGDGRRGAGAAARSSGTGARFGVNERYAAAAVGGASLGEAEADPD